MKIKSNEFLFARSQLVSAESSPKVGNAKQSQDKDERQNVIIVPTDDSRLKAIIIPRECLAHQSQSASEFDSVLATLTSL